MSFIYGYIDLNGISVSQNLRETIIECLSDYKLDSVRYIHFSHGMFLCGLQRVTPESSFEELPYDDAAKNLIITADAIIDNRNELLQIFGIPRTDWTRTADSELILLAYMKWKEDCPKHLIGDYSFVIWDKEKNEFFGARDHVGKRTFYYHYRNNLFIFSTTMKPILASDVCGSVLNDSWIADYLSIEYSLAHEIDCTKTVYKNIQQLLPGHCFKLNKQGIHIIKYWNPVTTPELKFKTDSEYEEAFREVFFEAVNCRLRNTGSVGIMLSGGLDSTSVASIAAMKLQENNKILKAYSAIPVSYYKNWLSDNEIADEREYIEELTNQYQNIKVEYCNFEKLNAASNIEELLSMLEQPYKVAGNLFWIDKITEKAYQDGCRVILDGQYGNLTVSVGGLSDYLLALYRRGRYVKLLEEFKNYSAFHNVNYQKILKFFLKRIIPEQVLNTYRKIRKRDISEEMPLSFVNENFAKKEHADIRVKKYEHIYRKRDLYDKIKNMNDIISFSHIGSIETKLSLNHGIIKRDPTRDKRIIEFCMKVPIDQYVHRGEDRSLIRRSLNGIVPDKIRLNYNKRGRQAADFVQRLKTVWPDVKNQIDILIRDERLKKYIDSNKITQLLNAVSPCPKDQDYYIIQTLITCLVFGKFIINERG